MAVTLNANTSTGFIATSDTSGVLQLQTGGTTAVTVDASQNVTLAGTLTATGVTTVPAGTVSAPAITTTGDTNTGIYFPAADTIAFSEGGVESMRIDASGNVGIGTGSPAISGLEISRATGSATPTPVELRLTTTTNDSGWSTSNPWGRISFYSADASVGGAKVHASIQTTAQSSTGGNSNLDFFVTDTANGNLYRTLSFQGAGTNTTQTVFYSGGGTEAARIDSSGNLLVGTQSEISVAGVTADHALIGTTGNGRWATAVRNTGNSTPWGLAIQYSAAAPNNTSQNFLYCYDTVAEKCSIRSNGGVANYSANDVNLASDLRLKHDIEPVQSYWNVFKSIEWKTWLYNDQTDEIKNIGVIAQELQALAPELVCESNALPTPEGESPYLGLWENDFKMAGMSVITELVKRCEEQQALITQLQADVAALKGASA